MKESPIFVKSYDFTRWLLEHTLKFPKSQRFVMAKRVEEAALSFHDLLLLAVKEGKEKKKRVLSQAGFELERLRHYLRLCKDLNLLSLNQYEYTSREMVEIGRLLGGWLKKLE
ncbi:MAG: diversity-generating retroelement protein Avd [bacterium]